MTKCGLDSALEPQEAPLGYQQSRTSCSFGLVFASTVFSLWKGLFHLPQELLRIFSTSDQDLALALDRQEAEEEEGD